MPHEQPVIRTADGECPAHLFTRSGGDGPWPAVILYMDAGGIRPGVEGMAARLAEAGYVVLLPDLFYRAGPYGPFVPREVFAGDFRAVLGPLMATTGNDKAAADTSAFIAYLDPRDDGAGRKLGAVGFCMGRRHGDRGGGDVPGPLRGSRQLSWRPARHRPARQPAPARAQAAGGALHRRRH